MRQTRLIMGMPVSIEIADGQADQAMFDETFGHFTAIDERFSTYKPTSEITQINEQRIAPDSWSPQMQEVMRLCDEMNARTDGYFDIRTPQGSLDPSGLVKGWAIQGASGLLERRGAKDFYVEAGGDIQTRGLNAREEKWRVGIKHPFDQQQNVKVVRLGGQGIATSGTYIRGAHIYDPHEKRPAEAIASITVIGPNVYEADCLATAAFAMGEQGIHFIEREAGFEAYSIDRKGIATMTSGFSAYLDHA